jgi:hypothetical protein
MQQAEQLVQGNDYVGSIELLLPRIRAFLSQCRLCILLDDGMRTGVPIRLNLRARTPEGLWHRFYHSAVEQDIPWDKQYRQWHFAFL